MCITLKDRMVMGINLLEVEVGNPANPEVTKKLDFLVDSSNLLRGSYPNSGEA